jgi:hypothetical protein
MQMTVDTLNDTICLLRQTPAGLRALLHQLPDTLVSGNEGADTWSVSDVIAHLIHGERTDWMPRVRMVLEAGESSTFEPFDRWGFRRDQEGKTLRDLLDTFARLRADNLDQLRALNLGPSDLARRGRHPTFGTVALSQLLATWAAHDLSHLHQIARVMAHQYRDAVGPWVQFLGVMHCSGHSR